MNIYNLTKKELLEKCKKLNIKNYSSKNKNDLILLIKNNKINKNIKFIIENENEFNIENENENENENEIKNNFETHIIEEKMNNKKNKGQFYTTNCCYILENMKIPFSVH